VKFPSGGLQRFACPSIWVTTDVRFLREIPLRGTATGDANKAGNSTTSRFLREIPLRGTATRKYRPDEDCRILDGFLREIPLRGTATPSQLPPTPTIRERKTGSSVKFPSGGLQQDDCRTRPGSTPRMSFLREIPLRGTATVRLPVDLGDD
jgi:hypothetical protein